MLASVVQIGNSRGIKLLAEELQCYLSLWELLR